MHFCFVSTRRGSYFMTELLSAISAATAAAGHPVELVFDEFPPRGDDCVYVVVPHEFHAWGNPGGIPRRSASVRQTIALCTENPGTVWFEQTYELVSQFAAAVSINRSSAAELQRRGIRCEHLQLGYSSEWDSWLGDKNVRQGHRCPLPGSRRPPARPAPCQLGRGSVGSSMPVPDSTLRSPGHAPAGLPDGDRQVPPSALREDPAQPSPHDILST